MRDSSTFLVAEMLFGAINADAGMLFSLVPLEIMIRFPVQCACMLRRKRREDVGVRHGENYACSVGVNIWLHLGQRRTLRRTRHDALAR